MYEAYIIGKLGDVVEVKWFASYSRALSWLKRAVQEGEAGYILEHYRRCFRSGECDCVQYAPDHRPVVVR